MIPDRNLDLYIGRKSTRNVNHVGNFFLILIIYTCLKYY